MDSDSQNRLKSTAIPMSTRCTGPPAVSPIRSAPRAHGRPKGGRRVGVHRRAEAVPEGAAEPLQRRLRHQATGHVDVEVLPPRAAVAATAPRGEDPPPTVHPPFGCRRRSAVVSVESAWNPGDQRGDHKGVGSEGEAFGR